MLFDQALDIPESLNSDGLKISLISERLRYSVRIKQSDFSAVKKLSGLKFPTKIGKASLSAKCDIHCLGPDEWLVIAQPSEKTKLAKSFAKIEKEYAVSITEVSHRNIGFEITGPMAVKVINVGCSLDLSMTKFPIGKSTRTAYESASIILTRKGENAFTLECWRSFAPYLRDYFKRIIETND